MTAELDVPASKAIKLTHSPTPAAARLLTAKHQANNATTASSEYAPTVNIQVVTATILYLAFSHLDHWPVQLVKAYAEDCFGPRSWVDNEACKLLVDNLRLLHKPARKLKSKKQKDSEGDNADQDVEMEEADEEVEIEMEDAALLEDAEKVYTAYSKLQEFISEDDANNDHASPSQQRRGSLSSVGSSGAGPISQSIPQSASLSSLLTRSNSKDEVDSVASNLSRKKKAKLAKKLLKQQKKLAKAKSGEGGGSSSSSGEEDEEVLVTAKIKKGGEDTPNSPTNSHLGSETGTAESLSSSTPKRLLYPMTKQKLNLLRVRQRFFGANRDAAQDVVSDALSERLDSKAKQNSALLQTLHSFASIPAIRSLVAGNLEKWLQSPGLSSLGRTLFTAIVKHIKNVDPPHPADLEAIKKILAMRLKANQLSAHIENVTAIATTIPTATVAREIYHQLLSEVLATMGRGANASASDELKMVVAVYSALPKGLSSDGIAASLLLLIGSSVESVSANQTQLERKQLIKRLKHILRLIAQKVGANFDVCKLLESLLAYNIKDEAWTVQDEEDRARLVFECIILLVPAPPQDSSRNPTKINRKGATVPVLETDALKGKLTTARKLVLSWFCTDFGPQFATTPAKSNDNEAGAGAGIPDYESALGGICDKKRLPDWLKTARCLLFMEGGDSPVMQRFVRGSSAGLDDNDPAWQDEKYRIDQCCEHGCDFDDEMMGTILKSASLETGGISSEMALTLLEHLFECCSIHRGGSLNITDMMLAWELYSLVVYEPPETVRMPTDTLKADDGDPPGSRFDDADEENNGNSPMDGVVETADLDLPQLAYPGLWWRVTILALVMCGVDPKQIGATVWEEHPTLRSMIKMVISSRYRFPTVDCDDADRAETKKNEQQMREEESKIAEMLFLPPKTKAKNGSAAISDSHGRSRVSARQQQKRDRSLRKKREKEVAEALAVENKRKKKLRAAQKSIILWDPTSAARKPPREAAELLVAAEANFGLSKTFQRTVEPDFLLMTIGKTTRGAIERAYDWLIPIISDMPDTIARLHASASCVLLLRAYGTEGNERAQLKELSAPLLGHVRDSLTGNFGQSDAEMAFDLLMSDVASRNPDRRRCSRRVLYDSLKELETPNSEKPVTSSSWMLNILRLKHAKLLVADAIKHMSTAIGFERGSVLKNILMALNELIAYAKDNEIKGDWNFASVLIGLLSSRPSVCAEALDRFVDVRRLGIRTVHEEFQKKHESNPPTTQAVEITLCRKDGGEKVELSLFLLQAAAVLLSIWREETNGATLTAENDTERESKDRQEIDSFIKSLADMLLRPIDGKKSDDDDVGGLATAKMAETGMMAVSIESWVMLAKARSDTIARRAALTAPTGFLPRLLLCSGLPRASLLTMIDRLGKMGEVAEEPDHVFNKLLTPSATSQWDIGRLGHRREIARKLLGRLSAYLRMNSVSVSKEETTISTLFLVWLTEDCSAKEKPKKPKNKQKAKFAAMETTMLNEASSFLETLGDANPVNPPDFRKDNGGEAAEIDSFRSCLTIDEDDEQPLEQSALEKSVSKAIEETQPQLLENVLRHCLEDDLAGRPTESVDRESLSVAILRKFLDLQHQQDSITRLVLAYVPQLSRLSGSPKLWQLVFAKKEGEASEILDTLVGRCTATWCQTHLASCYTWLLSLGTSIDAATYSISRAGRYLVLTSGQHSIHIDRFSVKVAVKCVDSWGKSEEFAVSSAAIAFEGMKQSTSSGGFPGLLSRNYLPDWLVIILALAKCGRVQMKYICESVIQRIAQPSNDLSLPLLRAVFLRLYVSNPQGMNLGSAKIRTVLMEAAEEYSTSWLDWRSPLDDQLNDMLETVTSGSGQRLIRPLADLSKKHPLLLLRKSHAMVQFLEQDAAVGVVGANDVRGVVRGQSLTGPLNIVQSAKLVKLVIRHWGFKYTEYVWIALLDILCAVPGPVLFGCGLEMGFFQFLNVNVRLIFVQSQLRRSERDFRLKDKLKEVFAMFRRTNPSGWEKWMSSIDHGLPSLGEMRNVMICCDFFDPKDVLKPNNTAVVAGAT